MLLVWHCMHGSGVDVFAVQPGLTSTSLYSGMQKTFLFYWFFRTMTFVIGQCPERGCLSLLYCATAPELTGQSVLYDTALNTLITLCTMSC